jgi:hypothetical protein
MSGNRPTEDWWTPQQAQLVEDRERTWQRADFTPSDMVLFRRGDGQGSIGRRLLPDEIPPSNGEIVKGGWDHEHCQLCSTKISAAGGNPSQGYTDGKGWLCSACFDRYIAPRVRR